MRLTEIYSLLGRPTVWSPLDIDVNPLGLGRDTPRFWDGIVGLETGTVIEQTVVELRFY